MTVPFSGQTHTRGIACSTQRAKYTGAPMTGSAGVDWRGAVFRLRGGIWAAAFVAAWVFARPTPALLTVVISMVAAGHALRFWAAGYIPAYRGESLEAPRLTTSGPYALVRNPLYIGNALIGLGWSVPAGRGVILLFAVLFVAVYGLVIVPHEEAFLARTFGPAYERYRSVTGRWVPKQRPTGRIAAAPFDWQFARRSEMHSLWLNVLATVLIATRPLVPLMVS
jgi:protein-S-isoprenylcysteine O-methyltransferase Ste14